MAHRRGGWWRTLASLWLAAALLCGWQAALQHPIEHVDELGEFVHLHDDHSYGDESSAGLLCDALAALAACASAAIQAVALSERPSYSLPLQHQGAPRAADAPPFLSQGPPASV